MIIPYYINDRRSRHESLTSGPNSSLSVSKNCVQGSKRERNSFSYMCSKNISFFGGTTQHWYSILFVKFKSRPKRRKAWKRCRNLTWTTEIRTIWTNMLRWVTYKSSIAVPIVFAPYMQSLLTIHNFFVLFKHIFIQTMLCNNSYFLIIALKHRR